MSNRRKQERFNLVIPTRLMLTTDDQDTEVFEMNTCNICAGGAYIKTKHSIPEGVRVTINFVLPIEQLARVLGVCSFITVKGKVVRVEMEGIAVSFDDDYKLMPFWNI